MTLSEQQLTTLEALEKLASGDRVTFVNFVVAQSLVKAGLAESSAEGKYAITEKGRVRLREHTRCN